MAKSFLTALAFFALIALPCWAHDQVLFEELHLDGESKLSIPPTWRMVGPVSEGATLKFNIALRQRNLDVLEKMFYEVSDPRHSSYGQHMTLEEIRDIIAPSEQQIDRVIEYVKSFGVSSYMLSNSHDFLTIWVSKPQAEKLLSCKFFQFEHEKTGVRLSRCATAYAVRSDIAPLIDFISGVRHFPKVNEQQQQQQHREDELALGVTPNVIRDLYNIGDVQGQSSDNKQAVAQFLNQWYSQADLDEFFLTLYRPGIGDKPTVVGTNKFPPGTEASLDIQYIMSVGAKVPTEFWSNDDLHENQEPFLEWIMAVGNDTSPPYVFSVSYGDDEYTISEDYANRCNVEFQKQGLRGISILFASGDSGVGGQYNGRKCLKFDPNFPVSSPYVTGVGGTALFGKDEKVNGLSGGGRSNYFPMPAYQEEAVNNYFQNNSNLPPANLYNHTGRAYPDISALSQGFVVVIDRVPTPGVAGTSCAAPTVSGVISLLNDVRLQNSKSPLGFLNPLLYQWGANNTGVFNDINSGCNPGCGTDGFCAIEGYDLSSGWGSPNYEAMAKAVAELP